MRASQIFSIHDVMGRTHRHAPVSCAGSQGEFMPAGRELYSGVVRRIQLMSMRAIRLLVMATALFLVLPPGWCITLPTVRNAKSVSPKACCCSHVRPNRPRSPAPKPVRTPPVRGCCCRVDLSATPKAEIPVESTSVATALVAMADPVSPQHFSSVGYNCFISLPCPQVLNCVWLC